MFRVLPRSLCAFTLFDRVVEEVASAFNDGGVDDEFAASGLVWQAVHDVEHQLFTDRAESASACFAFECPFGDGVECVGRELEGFAVHLEEFLVLTDECIARFGEDGDECFEVERIEAGDERESADEFGDEAILNEVFGLNFAEDARAFGDGVDAVAGFGEESDLLTT